jgi:tetratricopeptide (TPR) repeat protein
MGSGALEEMDRHWKSGEGLPYMEACLGYAEALLSLGRREEAVERFQELLRLDPPDGQRVREPLVNVLIALDRDEEAQALLDGCEDKSTLMGFSRTLLRFRREGDSIEARRCLKEALKANRFVPGLLIRTRKMPFPTTFSLPGTEEEAAAYFSLSHETWEKTPGALDWLRERTVAAVRSKSRAKARGKTKKKRR